MEAQAKTNEGGNNVNGDGLKNIVSGIPMIITCPMVITQNTATQKATHTVTHVATTFPQAQQ